MAKYIPLDAVVAMINKRKEAINPTNSHTMYVPNMDKFYRGWMNALSWVEKEIINTLKVKEVDLELITEWFDHIAQIANDRKTANGEVMEDQAALDEIKCLARESSEFIRTHCEQKVLIHIVDEETGNVYDVEIDKLKHRKENRI